MTETWAEGDIDWMAMMFIQKSELIGLTDGLWGGGGSGRLDEGKEEIRSNS